MFIEIFLRRKNFLHTFFSWVVVFVTMFLSFHTVAVPSDLVEHGSVKEKPLRKLAKVVSERASYLSVQLEYL